MSQEHPDAAGDAVVKWYTRARKFPQLIGRTPDGARIPGGPYTITQTVGAGGVLFIGLNTMSVWARFGFFTNLLALATATFATVWLLGRIPIGARNPLSVVSGIVHAVATPAHGRMGGRAIRIKPPHQVRHRVLTPVPEHRLKELSDTPGTAGSRPNPQPAPPAATDPAPPPAREDPPNRPREPALTGVQAILAGQVPHRLSDHHEGVDP